MHIVSISSHVIMWAGPVTADVRTGGSARDVPKLVQMGLMGRNANSHVGTVMETVRAITLTEVARMGVHQDGPGLYAMKSVQQGSLESCVKTTVVRIAVTR